MSSALLAEAFAARVAAGSSSSASVSLRSTPRRHSPHRAPHRPWAALHQRLDVSSRADVSACTHGTGLAYMYGSGTFSHGVGDDIGLDSSADGLDALGSSAASSVVGVPIQEPGVTNVAPGPVQLEVVHIWKAQNIPCAGELSIVLPDGTALGNSEPIKASDGMRTVVLMPGGVSVGAARSQEVVDAPLRLQAPSTMRDKAKSISERLSLLLAPEHLPSRSAAPSGLARFPTDGSRLLRNNKSAVLTQADSFVDAILQHILADTTKALNSMPSKSGKVRTKDVHKEAKEACVEVGPARVHMYAAAEQLHDLERRLVQRYTGEMGQAEAGAGVMHNRLLSEHGAAALLLRQAQPTPWEHELRLSREVQRLGQGRGEARRTPTNDVKELCPAALPLERVREIEKYRTRFAHHCLACREAGIYRGDPGDVTCVATWTIWPHIADAIVLAVVEGAIEDVHEAMECHVEELVNREVAGLH